MKRIRRLLKSGSIIVFVVLAACSMSGLTAVPASAISGSDWQPGRIIDDSVFYNKSAMNTDQIQQFLNAKVPTCDSWGTQSYAGTTRRAYSEARGIKFPLVCLKDYQENPSTHANNLDGNPVPAGAKSAASIIWEAAQTYNINPQVLIVLLQKEQGLVTDDWPWPVQYKSATGYGCPDTAPCDSEYYGFYNQVKNAARQFRLYANNPNAYNHVPYQNNSVRFNPNASCGSSSVYIQNQATASLYNYTPYQPNQAALNNLYGTGDGCSAYGNRNFWTYFNDWFGMSFGDGFALVKSDDPNDLRQWVVYGTIKQYVPSSQILNAWGLQNTPLGTMSSAALGSIPTGPSLDRLMRINGGSTVYFMDNGRRYRIPWQSLFDSWNFGGVTISSVSRGLGDLPIDSGDLTFSVKRPGTNDIYMMDGRSNIGWTVLRKYQNDTVRGAWEGDNAPFTNVSADYWDLIDDAIGPALTSTKVKYGDSEYQVFAGRKFVQPASIGALYPGTAQAISPETQGRLVQANTITHMLRSASSPTVYMVDGGTKHQVLWPDLLTAWTPGGTGITVVNNSFIDLLTTGGTVSNYVATAGSDVYVIDQQKRKVPAALTDAYGNATTPYAASAALLNLFPTGPAATGFVKAKSAPQVYLLDDSGKKRHMEWADKVSLWGGYAQGVTELSDYIMSSWATAQNPNVFVTDGSTEYLIEGGKKWTVTSGIKTDWGLGTPQSITDGTLDRLPLGGAMGNAMADGKGGYYIIRGGAAYGTADPAIAQAWGIQSAPVRDPALIRSLVPQYMLTKFVRSNANGDNRLFMIVDGQWRTLSDAQAANVGVGNQPVMRLNPSFAPSTPTDWTSLVVKDAQNNHYVIDGGAKRPIMHDVIRNQWTNNGAIAVPTVSDAFLQAMPTGRLIERTIKGNSPSVYFVENNKKRHIRFPDTYNRSYAPYAQVSDALVNVLADGEPI